MIYCSDNKEFQEFLNDFSAAVNGALFKIIMEQFTKRGMGPETPGWDKAHRELWTASSELEKALTIKALVVFAELKNVGLMISKIPPSPV